MSVISLILSLLFIIWILFKIDLKNNILFFEENSIIHKQKDKIVEYSYQNVIKNEFINQQRSQSFVRLTLKDKEINYLLDTESGLDFKIEDFADFLLSKNNSIEFLLKQTNFETYKYFKNGEELRRILLN